MRTLFTAFFVLCATASSLIAESARIPLAEGWHLQHASRVEAGGARVASPDFAPENWYPTRVPATVLAALVKAGVYPDPYYGLNMASIPGYMPGLLIAMPEDSPFRGAWWYRTSFTLPEDSPGRHITLHLDGINYEAEVWLNGERIATAEDVRGMFRRFAFPVTEQVRADGENVLAVKVTGPGQLPVRDYKTKQIEATTGWDDHNPWPPDLNTGIWEDVYLAVHGPVTLRDPYVETDLALPGLNRAALTVSAWMTNHGGEEVTAEFRAAIDGITVAREYTLGPGETREAVLDPARFPELVLENPRVWWPAGLGDPELYDAEVSVVVDGAVSTTESFRFGVRHVETHLNADDWRVYSINGRNVLVRGGAWMTSDMMLELSEARYEALVRYAREANLNMLRSEGFSIRETDEFYRLCDEYGIMVTQQIFGRSIPDEGLAAACAEDMMLRIRKHPSLVHFLGHDETYPTPTLDATYQHLIQKHRLHRTYQPHSGTFYVPQRKDTGGTRTGTRELWTYAGPEHYYHRKFDGAWGFAQSGGIGGIVAAEDSLRQMLPEDQLWPVLETEGWSLHSVAQGAEYFATFTDAMARNHGAPDNLDDFLRKAYAMNYNNARGMFEAYARNKYEATGLTTWKYNAAWPAAMTWQYVDWYLRPTAAYYGAQLACKPLHIQYGYDDRGVWVVNAHNDGAIGLRAEATVFGLDLKPLFEQSETIDVRPDGKTLAFAIPEPEGWSKVHFLRLVLRDGENREIDRNVYWLSTTPDIPGRSGYGEDGIFRAEPRSSADFTPLNSLPPAQVTAEAKVTRNADELTVETLLRNDTEHLAFLAWMDIVPAPGQAALAPVYWSENCITLFPGESRKLTARMPAAISVEQTPSLRLRGWNVPETVVPITAP